jgi:hypothetical protein
MGTLLKGGGIAGCDCSTGASTTGIDRHHSAKLAGQAHADDADPVRQNLWMRQMRQGFAQPVDDGASHGWCETG